MAAPGPALKLRRWRQRFGISAPKMAIRTHVAWYWRALAVVGALSLSLVIAAWVYDTGLRMAGFRSNETGREIQSLRNHVMELDTELTKLRALAGAGESRLQIEQAALRQLTSQVRALEAENAALKEDLALFEGLMSGAPAAVSDEGGVRVEHLRVEPTGASGEYRYRMLLVNNASRQGKEFKGVLELQIKGVVAGKDATISLPEASERNAPRYRVEFRYFQRLDGVFVVPEGMRVQSVVVGLLQDGVARAKQEARL